MNFIQELEDDDSILGLHFALGGEGKVCNTSDEEGSQQLSLDPGTLVGTLGGHTDVQQGLDRGDLVAVALCLANIGIAFLVEETHLHIAAAALLDVLYPAQLRKEGRGGLALAAWPDRESLTHLVLAVAHLGHGHDLAAGELSEEAGLCRVAALQCDFSNMRQLGQNCGILCAERAQRGLAAGLGASGAHNGNQAECKQLARHDVLCF